ncbi:hypothetical protein RQP46_000958 [Phenoliferia psychrophenolica]
MDILDLCHDISPRPFACSDFAAPTGGEWCTKRFGRKSDLIRHLRIHSDERPFACDWPGCSRGFCQRSALTVHYRVQ